MFDMLLNRLRSDRTPEEPAALGDGGSAGTACHVYTVRVFQGKTRRMYIAVVRGGAWSVNGREWKRARAGHSRASSFSDGLSGVGEG